MQSIVFYISNWRVLALAVLRKCFFWLPDPLYLKLLYRLKFQKRLNLINPQTFSEKMQWLKLYDRKEDYHSLVDKVEVKTIVAKTIGEEYVIPTLGVWNNVDEVDWEILPEKFVIKPTHGGGGSGIVICNDKSTFDRSAAKRKLSQALKDNQHRITKEWPYQGVPHRLIAEPLIEGLDGERVSDYKYFCFNGEPLFCQVISGRGKKMCIDFFDTEWHHMPFHEPANYSFADQEPSRPVHHDVMLSLARQLALGKSFVRVDFYDVGGKVFFGEITFFPTSGIGGFEPKEWDLRFGQMITLPERSC